MASGEQPVLVLVRWHRLELWLCRELWLQILAAAGERQLALWLWLDPPALLPQVHWRRRLQSQLSQSQSHVTVTVSLKLSIDGRYH